MGDADGAAGRGVGGDGTTATGPTFLEGVGSREVGGAEGVA